MEENITLQVNIDMSPKTVLNLMNAYDTNSITDAIKAHIYEINEMDGIDLTITSCEVID